MSKKDIATTQAAGLPATIDFGADAGGGFEEADSQSYAIPFLKVLQSMSPQLKKSDGAYIKGAEEGDFFNTVSEAIVKGDAGVTVIPCHYKRVYIEWEAPQDEGGGYIAEHDVAEGEALLRQCERDPKGNDRLPNGHVIQDIRNHYCLVIRDDGTYEPVLLSLSSTQIKKSKKWMTLMQNMKLPNNAIAPMFSQVYRITSVPETRDQFSWFGVRVEHVGAVTSAEQYQAAKSFREMVRSGAARVEYGEPEREPGCDDF